MSAPAVSACTAVLNQQREHAIQHHQDQCDKATIAPCKALARSCTIVENGQVVVRTLPVEAVEPPADISPEA